MPKHPKGYTKRWKELREKTIKRDGKICSHCHNIYTKKGKIATLNLSHILPVGEYPNMTFEPENVVILCHHCHFFWWHKNPIEAYLWIKETKGQAFINKLIKKAHESIQANKQH